MRLTVKSCSIAAAILLSLLTQGRLCATPGVVSATPSSGIGFTQTFALVYSSSGGFASLTNVQVNFSSPLSGANACYLAYVPAGNYISLVNDAGTAFGAGVTLGSSGTAQNSQCSVSAATSTHSGLGNNLTVNLAITFSSPFAGTKTIYMNASDSSGGTNWLTEGTWTVGTPTVPSSVSVAPSSGTGLSQTFSMGPGAKILKGCQVGSILTLSDGTPVMVGGVGDPANLGNGEPQIPDATGISPIPANRTAQQFWNVQAFNGSNPQLQYRFGNSGRNTEATGNQGIGFLAVQGHQNPGATDFAVPLRSVQSPQPSQLERAGCERAEARHIRRRHFRTMRDLQFSLKYIF
jgi:hypothetical protein